MSDSESESNNVFTFQNTTVNARGPNTNISNFNFRSKYVPRNFERQRYAESVSDQRSIYYRRETSPMSIHSACDFRSRNFQQYQNRMGCQQSLFNGRSGSPMSMRSIDSSASVSAADIAFALNNVKFNKYDLKVIKEAYQKAMKQRFRNRIEKRRNMRLFLKGSRHRSGDDSGEQGSDSSISSDDCRSIQTSYKENISSSKSARIDLSHYRKPVRDNNVEFTESFRQKNIFSMSTSNFSRNHTFNSSSLSQQINPMPTQKDRFRNGFLLPSQRFNRSIASSVIPESMEKHHKNMDTNFKPNRINHVVNRPQANKNRDNDSEEEIFSGMTLKDKVIHNIKPHHKRNLDSDDDLNLPDKKKTKISSPVKKLQPSRKLSLKENNMNPINNNNANSNNFEFAKPALPVKKTKSKVQEKVIAKSKQPLTGFVEHVPAQTVNNVIPIEPTTSSEKPNDNQIPIDKDTMNHESTQNSNVSMRPSFIKRKLFTQKLDVGEKANLSSDTSNSPQTNVYGAIQKEKNKARKLVATQSCLNRDVQDDSNLLDLIHKIVPPDRINITNQTTMNQSKIDVTNANNKDDDDDKWDVTSVISMCHDNNVSDTFTDEEIFENDQNKDSNKYKKNNSIKTSKNTKKTTKIVETKQKPLQDCRIVVEKLINLQKPVQNLAQNQKANSTITNASKSILKSSAKTFWDTDLESDAECQITTKRFVKETLPKANTAVRASREEIKQATTITREPVSKKPLQAPETSRWLNNTMNTNLRSSRKLDIRNLGVRSHRTTTKKKCCNEVCIQAITSNKPVVISKEAAKPAISNKIPTPKKNQAVVETTKNSTPKINTKAKKKNSKKPTSKSNAQKANKSRSSSRTRKTSNKTKAKADKKVEHPSELRTPTLNNRPIRSCRTPR